MVKDGRPDGIDAEGHLLPAKGNTESPDLVELTPEKLGLHMVIVVFTMLKITESTKKWLIS